MRRCVWGLVLLVGCTADELGLDANNGAVDSGIDAGTQDTGVRDAGELSCCLDLGCDTCPNGRFTIGGCGPEWCSPPFPFSCPAVPDPCPRCDQLDETECPFEPIQNVVGCVQQHCEVPNGPSRFLACVPTSTGTPPIQPCP